MADRVLTAIKPRKPRNLTGLKFGLLTAVELQRDERGFGLWLCACDCGGTKLVRSSELVRLNTKSCGCLGEIYRRHLRAALGVAARAHPLHKCWEKMRERCYNPRQHAFHRYGGRGIKVCARWRFDFAAFVADVGPRPSSAHSLDRIEKDGDYEPGNVRWATQTEQCRNQHTNRIVRFRGRTMTLAEAVELSGLPKGTVYNRLHAGWDEELALTQPARRNGRR